MDKIMKLCMEDGIRFEICYDKHIDGLKITLTKGSRSYTTVCVPSIFDIGASPQACWDAIIEETANQLLDH